MSLFKDLMNPPSKTTLPYLGFFRVGKQWDNRYGYVSGEIYGYYQRYEKSNHNGPYTQVILEHPRNGPTDSVSNSTILEFLSAQETWDLSQEILEEGWESRIENVTGYPIEKTAMLSKEAWKTKLQTLGEW